MISKGYLGMMAAFAAMLTEPIKTPERIRVVYDANYEDLINEYNLIQQKKSKLTRAQRESVISRVNWLVSKGHITLPQPPKP